MQAPRQAFPLPRSEDFLTLSWALLSDVACALTSIWPTGLSLSGDAGHTSGLPCLGFHLSPGLSCPVCEVPSLPLLVMPDTLTGDLETEVPLLRSQVGRGGEGAGGK